MNCATSCARWGMNAPDHCPECGTPQPLGAIGGLCPGCLARGGAEWLASPPPVAGDGLPDIPGWNITGTLGAGGMGRVFLAEKHDGTMAAIKVLDARWSRDPVMAARFENEAEAMRRLEHPGIVRLLETTETDDGRLGIVMEFIDGCDLGRLLRAELLPHARGVEIFRKVCAAVEHAHARGFVHRDIKPSNILVGRDGTVKLADFGLAKHLDDAGGTVIGGLTATTDQFGTAYYLAPERMMPGAKCGEQADVFSLGVLLYHLLGGRMPVGKYTPLSQLAGLPAVLDGIVARALEANPERRTASAATLRGGFNAAWNAHISGRSRAQQIRRAAMVAAGVVFTAAAVAAGALWQRERMKPPPPPVFVHPQKATEQQPWENSLGMKFVPVPGTNVLFSVWETRRRDFERFRDEDRGSISPWYEDHIKRQKAAEEHITTFGEGGVLHYGTWEDPGWPVTPDQPAGGLHIRQAQHFCLWLTLRERAEGRLPPGWRYRLPSTAEWLAAAGGEQAQLRPGNIAGTELLASGRWPAGRPTMPTNDGFLHLAPVGSFPPELHGLHDISGNVTEWVMDEDEPTYLRPVNSKALLRGPSCSDGTPETAAFSYVRPPMRAHRIANFGFRVVLEEPPDNAPEDQP